MKAMAQAAYRVTARSRHLRIASKIDIITIMVDDYDTIRYERIVNRREPWV
jgi:hypothetical protein